MMSKSSELLYWKNYKQYIHYDKEKDKYYYDPEIPERAKKSHEKWLKELF